MNDFYNKTEYTIDDVKDLIDNEIEESIHLDFKDAQALDKSDGKKKEISKDVSAFANSDGGIIIYGIKEANHKANSITYIDGHLFTKEWLEQTVSSSIQRRISNLNIYPVRNNGNVNETVYIVKIPKSYDTPHLCKDKRFYKRFNFESVPMEEYEIRQSYGQRVKSKLMIHGWHVGRLELVDNEDNKIKLGFEVSILNDGDIVESNYKVNVYFNNYNKLAHISWEASQPQIDYIWLGRDRIKVTSEGKASIYPTEAISAIRFNIDIPKDKIEESLKDVKVEIILFYSNGEERVDGDLIELMNNLLEFYNEKQ